MRATSIGLRTLALVVAFGCGAAICLVPGTAGAVQSKDKGKGKGKDKDGVNDMAGRARWNWRIVDKDKDLETGTFMGYQNGQIKHGKDQTPIGTYTSPSPGQIRAKFTAGPLVGEAVLGLTQKQPVKYEGQLTKPDGSKLRMVLNIVND